MTTDTTKAALAEARQALQGLLANIRRDAPQLSGKNMGYAEQAIESIDAALLRANAAVVPDLDVHDDVLRDITQPLQDEILTCGLDEAVLMRGMRKAIAAAVAQARDDAAEAAPSAPVLAEPAETEPEPPEGMRWFYCTTDVKEVHGHQVWRVAGIDLSDAQARYEEGDGEITDQELEVTDLDEPANWSPKS